jgi:hypothetical protein
MADKGRTKWTLGSLIHCTREARSLVCGLWLKHMRTWRRLEKSLGQEGEGAISQNDV